MYFNNGAPQNGIGAATNIPAPAQAPAPAQVQVLATAPTTTVVPATKNDVDSSNIPIAQAPANAPKTALSKVTTMDCS